jgi:lysophospholipase L1-like esterase
MGPVSPRGRASRLLLAMAAVLVGLLSAEALLRLTGYSFDLLPQVVELRHPDRRMENRYDPDQDLFYVTRVYSHALESLAGERPDIVFLGDSCTEFGDYPRRVVKRIERSLGIEGLVWRELGVAGYSTFQGRKQLERDVLRLRPRVITLYYGWNDHWLGLGLEDSELYALTHGLLGRPSGLRLGQVLVRGRLAWAIHRRGGRTLRVPIEDFRANLTAMVREARRHDIEPPLLTAPTAHRRGAEPDYLAGRYIESLEDLVPLHQRYVEIVREVAAAEEAPLCDLARLFETPQESRRLESLFDWDGIHLRPLGNDRLSHYVARCLLNNPVPRARLAEAGRNGAG